MDESIYKYPESYEKLVELGLVNNDDGTLSLNSKWRADHILIKENAISQKGYKTNPFNQGRTAPMIVDEGIFVKYGFEGVAYELPDPISRWLVEYAQNAKIIK